MTKIEKARCCGTCKHYRAYYSGSMKEMIGDCVFKFNDLKPTKLTNKCDSHEWNEGGK